jgi:hypothetical protein
VTWRQHLTTNCLWIHTCNTYYWNETKTSYIHKKICLYYMYVDIDFTRKIWRSEVVIRRTNNTMVNRKKTTTNNNNDLQNPAQKSKFQQNEPNRKLGVNSGSPKGKPFLLQTMHPSGYCCHKPGDKPWIRKRPDCVDIYMCTWTFDTVRLIRVILRSVLIKYTNDDQFLSVKI